MLHSNKESDAMKEQRELLKTGSWFKKKKKHSLEKIKFLCSQEKND